ncbi:DUF3796 domain-containing protein [Enterococcus hulanensis]|uniref:DUF3796 domain-containing protein n=1 Tax=Enterococcus TaxID=1350 RepID=UPI000B5AA501|nr:MULTISPECIES: DUF3796 domain-containing protein [Enterococcus]MBO0412905.1 DUF3796 domain-containing protein [Enterococcus hulanensis]MDT2661405.1 DUF3796 domain-containing protein [Enterococcus hulanensis]OTO19950.1 hypothetical protein A5875_001299 [Enterococcus sp. 3H8_DIV0648]
MSKKKIRNLVVSGIGCVIVLVLATVHSVLYNESRLVKPTVVSEYVFRPQDLPMWIALVVTIVYVIYLVVTLFRVVWRNKSLEKHHTRRIHPMLGLSGFAGFLGLIGFWTYQEFGIIYPCFAFVFFGFFGFYFEGKLSDTLKDELYEENEKKAELKAYKIGFILLFLTIWLIGGGMLAWNLEWCAIFMLSSMSMIFGIVLFLSKYFLYRFETEAG